MDAYLGVPYVDRSKFLLQFQQRDQVLNDSKIKGWEERAKKKPTLPLSADAFVGSYYNHVYGNMQIVKENNELTVLLSHHPKLKGKLEYIDNKNFLLTWNHPSYGKFAVPFEIKNNKVSAIEIKASDFVEYDGYVFLKN
jgi:hypothetical protein